ncbi:MAG: Ig-like domain-containing protein [Gemmatimonadaceae bacterium]|nr:Ig-like domain-containing protein [Gemmatimonadaceae bacterium]
MTIPWRSTQPFSAALCLRRLPSDILPLRARTLACLAAVSTLLSACGGGGGSDSPPVTPPPPAVTAVTVAPGAVPLQGVGATATVTAALTPSTASATITWTSSNVAIATVAGSGSSAVVTGVAAGSATITATASGIAGSTVATVTPIVRTLTAPPSVNVLVGATTRPTVSVSADAGANAALTYTSNTPTVATVAADGTISGLAPGTATITVAATAFPTVTTTMAVTVAYPVVRSVIVAPATFQNVVGATRALTATVDVDAGTSTGVTWSSSDVAVATVSSSGVVSAVSVGAATIRATSVANPTVSGTAAATIVAPTVRSITLAPATASVVAGATRQLVATLDADAGANTSVTWSSTNSTVATVSQAGLVTAVQPGTATIRATSVLVPAVIGNAAITVTAPQPLAGWHEEQRTPIATRYNMESILQVATLENGTAWGLHGTETDERDMLYFDGTRWNMVNALPWNFPESIGSFGNSAWVGGRTGRLAQLVQSIAGTWQWNAMTSPMTGNVERIIGVASGQAVAMASAQVAVLSGGTWTLLPASGLTQQTDMDATSINNIVVVSTNAVGGSRIRRWNGTAWSIIPEPAAQQLFGVLMVGDSIITASGNNTSFLYNGTSWTSLTIPPSRAGTTSEFLYRMARCDGVQYAVSFSGHRVYRRNGTSWTVIGDYGVAAPGSGYGSLHCSTNGVLRSGGEAGAVGRFTGSQWVWEHSAGTVQRIRIVQPDLAYMTYGYGAIARWDGVQWRTELSDAQQGVGNSAYGPDGAFSGLSVAADGNVFVTGIGSQHSSRMYRRLPSGTWTTTTLGTRMRDVWAASGTFALAVGSAGALRFDGNTWQSVALATGFWEAIGGTSSTFALAVGSTTGSNSASARWDGSAWIPLTTPNVGALRRVSVVSPTLAWAVSSSGLLRWDGTQWTSIAVPVAISNYTPMGDIVALGANEVYVLIRGARLVRFDGTTWTQVATITDAEGDVRGSGARVMDMIPGYGIVGTGWGGVFHSTTPSASGAARRR